VTDWSIEKQCSHAGCSRHAKVDLQIEKTSGHIWFSLKKQEYVMINCICESFMILQWYMGVGKLDFLNFYFIKVSTRELVSLWDIGKIYGGVDQQFFILSNHTTIHLKEHLQELNLTWTHLWDVSQSRFLYSTRLVTTIVNTLKMFSRFNLLYTLDINEIVERNEE